ncbi:hypothetical protein MUK42_27823 [Musa troglodytarum]|uniref:Uncharacterized protein n=1 Tax=Musa troglodytarum TaxID=320322 RepID=A0A9E7FDG6_9LILI|nr:hypothetical protein MUK42_27823 [Musa troglodytarum]
MPTAQRRPHCSLTSESWTPHYEFLGSFLGRLKISLKILRFLLLFLVAKKNRDLVELQHDTARRRLLIWRRNSLNRGGRGDEDPSPKT